MAVVIGILATVILGQWMLIWQLINRILMQSRVPTLTPVRTTPPERAEPAQVDARKKLFSVVIDR